MQASATTVPAGPQGGAAVAQLQAKYGLSYHVPYALRAEATVGLRGRRVLEVGGSLPRDFVLDELGASQWVGIEEMDYWEHLPADGGGTRPEAGPQRRLKEIREIDGFAEYQVLRGGVEDLPAVMEGMFDVVFSVAAFEHILNFPLALDRMFAALKPGGKLFTMFSPIWSAHDGHHLPRIVAADGQVFGFSKSPIPPWGHLLLRPAQLMRQIEKTTDTLTAGKIVYYVFHSPHINRLFTEDYAEFIRASRFQIETLAPTFAISAPPEVLAELSRLHPNRTHFANNGLMAVLSRPAHPVDAPSRA
jgi:SAM-dependent methyltransferase